jgi:hypothetical protein
LWSPSKLPYCLQKNLQTHLLYAIVEAKRAFFARVLWQATKNNNPLNRAKANQFPGAAGTSMLLAWSPDGASLAIGNIDDRNADFSTAYLSIYTGNLSNPLTGNLSSRKPTSQALRTLFLWRDYHR